MIGLIVGIGAVLLLAIFFTIFKIVKLIVAARSSGSGDGNRRVSSSNQINAKLMLAFLVIAAGLITWYSISTYDQYTIPVASVNGAEIDRMFWITTLVTGIVFIVTQILLFYFSYKYRYQGNKKALYYPDNSKLEVVWTVIPAIVLSLLVFSGWKVWTDVTSRAPEDAEVVELLGYQFGWAIRYPGEDGELGENDYRLIDAENIWGMDFADRASFDDYTALEVHVPKGVPVLFKIRARDVLHSVYVPEFRLKQDAVPGMPTRFWFIPNKTTAEMKEELNNPDFEYNIYCTEVCGRGHFSMRVRLVVQEPDEYLAWKAEQKPWLQNNPDYLAKVPQSLKEVAMISAGIENEETHSEANNL